jgi:tetratricopeptide (TPR) repeat protein
LRGKSIEQFSEAILLSGLSYLLRRYKHLYSADCEWLCELYDRYQPDTAKSTYDSEAFHLAQRACLMMAPSKTMSPVLTQLAEWITDTDSLGVSGFTAWLKGNAEPIVRHLDDISVIDFTNTIGSAVEYVRKTTGPKKAAELRETGVYDIRRRRLGEMHTASVSTRYHLARLQTDAGDYKAAQDSYEHVYDAQKKIYRDKLYGHHLTCKTLAALADLPMTDPKSMQLLLDRFEKATSAMSREASASTTGNRVPDGVGTTGQILKARRDYAKVLGRSGKPKEALKQCNNLVNDFAQQGKSMSNKYKGVQVDVFDIAGQMCEQLERPSEAIQWLERAKTFREQLVPNLSTEPTAHHLHTLDLLARSYWLDVRLQPALDMYSRVAAALRQRVEDGHAAQVWRWQEADKRTAHDWLLSVESRIAKLELEVRAARVRKLFGRSTLAVLVAALLFIARKRFVGLLTLVWHNRGSYFARIQ